MQHPTPQQALANLEAVAQQYRGTRADHITLELSLKALASLVEAAAAKAAPAAPAPAPGKPAPAATPGKAAR